MYIVTFECHQKCLSITFQIYYKIQNDRCQWFSHMCTCHGIWKRSEQSTDDPLIHWHHLKARTRSVEQWIRIHVILQMPPIPLRCLPASLTIVLSAAAVGKKAW